MGLQVWLPLNGNLDNQGLGSFSPTLSNGSWDNNGKIGQCYNSNGSGVINLNNSITLDGAFSICCWVKVSSSHTSAWARVFGLYKNVNEYIGVCCNNTSPISLLGFHIYDLVNDAKKGLIDTYRIQAKLDQWTHIAVSVDGTALKMYQDGVLLFTYTLQQQVNDTYTVNQLCAQNGSAKLNCCINDFRIYDHALSPREVKEISKGLVLHYPLAMLGQENLVVGSNTGSTSTNKWLGHSAVGGNTSTIEVDETGTNCVKVTRDSTAQSSWDYLSYDALLRNQLKTNTTYTVSFDAKPSIDGTINLVGLMNGNATNNMTVSVVQVQNSLLANKWNRCVYHCTTLDSFDGITISGQVVYLSRSTSLKGVNTTVLFKNIKVEEGEIATPWIPNPVDTAYSNLGFNDGIEYDVSGYQHNGTKYGTLTYSSDTPRYNTSTILDGTYISLASLTNSTISQFSICGWANLLTGYTANYGCHLINFNKTYCRICISKDGAALRILLTDGTTNYTLSSVMTASSLSANVWNHYAVTFDNGSIKIYINGQLDRSAQAAITAISPDTSSWTIGNHGTTELPKSKVSDIRLYSTVLSADDILELYHTPVSLSSNGTLLTQGELVEV